jgi:HAD superfamily phosphatase
LSFSNKCIIFDVDGVLIDTRFSYNIAIRKTVELVFSKIESGIFDKPLVTDEMIYEFRQTGNFNNDTDTAYAILLCNLCLPHKDTQIRNFIMEVVKKATYNGIISVEQYLSSLSRNRMSLVKTRLNYPNDVTESIVTRIFDEYFYGPVLFRKKYGRKPLYYFGRPLINKDRILIKKSVLRKVSDLFCERVAIITGRSKLASQYSLGMIYASFDQEASTYLEDVDRNFRKPNPHSLEKSLNLLSSTQGFYVGDSSEDLIMAKKLNRRKRYNIQFIGVYGASINPEKTREFFLKNHCLAVKTVNEIPNILYKVRSKS